MRYQGLPAYVAMTALLGMANCSGTIDLYHRYEGGAVAGARQAPPGAEAPYPNLAAVPAAPVALTAAQTAAVAQRVAPTAPALTALALPGAVPPTPELTGLTVPLTEAAPPLPPAATVRIAPAVAARPPAAPDNPPLLLGFAPGSAILTHQTVTALQGLAAARGGGRIIAGGFGETGLTLGVERARAIADGLTAAGVPATAITLAATAAGSGGFAELVY